MATFTVFHVKYLKLIVTVPNDPHPMVTSLVQTCRCRCGVRSFVTRLLSCLHYLWWACIGEGEACIITLHLANWRGPLCCSRPHCCQPAQRNRRKQDHQHCSLVGLQCYGWAIIKYHHKSECSVLLKRKGLVLNIFIHYLHIKEILNHSLYSYLNYPPTGVTLCWPVCYEMTLCLSLITCQSHGWWCIDCIYIVLSWGGDMYKGVL